MSTTITAAVLTRAGQPLRLQEVHIDDPLDAEVLVRVERVGLCHSDLHYLRGSLSIDMPAILGHEVSGTVEKVGSLVKRVRPGDRVVATVTPACGACSQCLSGRPTQCQRVDEARSRPRPKHWTSNGAEIVALGGVGAFAEAILVTEASLAVVDRAISVDASCLLGCCISTGVGAAVHGALISSQDTVAVIGCGGVGIAAIQGARVAGARRVVAVDAVPEKLELAMKFGASDAVLAGADADATVEAVFALVAGGVTHAIEAVGTPATAELAFKLLAPAGTATILGLMPEGSQLSLNTDALVYGDRRIQGAYMGANRFLSDVDLFADHYKAGRLDLDSMVSQVLPFASINEGFAAMARPDTVRIVVDVTK